MRALALIRRVQGLQRLRDQLNPPEEEAPPPPPPEAEKFDPTDARLYDVVPRLHRTFVPPYHLDPLVGALEEMWTSPVFQTHHAPPRHGKTDTICAWIALTLAKFPWETVGYVTYSADRARSVSRKIRAWARFLGVDVLRTSSKLGEWRTSDGGGLLAMGIDGAFTGYGVNKLVVDDPYKNRKQAESPAWKRMVIDWWNGVAATRLEPGASVLISHTRWTEDDLIAHVTEGEAKADFRPHVRQPAIDEQGQALWPDRWPIDALERKQRIVGPYDWGSLYQGLPTPRGGKVFLDAVYGTIPAGVPFRRAAGVDLSYSAKTKADWCVVVIMDAVGWGANARYYIRHVERMRQGVPAFLRRLAELEKTWGVSTSHCYIGGTEKGVVDLAKLVTANGEINQPTAHIDAKPAVAKGDKFIRAQPFAAAWNGVVKVDEDGLVTREGARVFVPEGAPWLKEFLAELSQFTGVDDAHDDQIDAGAAAFDALNQSNSMVDALRQRLEREAAAAARPTQ